VLYSQQPAGEGMWLTLPAPKAAQGERVLPKNALAATGDTTFS